MYIHRFFHSTTILSKSPSRKVRPNLKVFQIAPKGPGIHNPGVAGAVFWINWTLYPREAVCIMYVQTYKYMGCIVDCIMVLL